MSPKAGGPAAAGSFGAVRDKHAEGNRRSRDDWELYRPHREHLTRLIAGIAAREGTDGPEGALVLLGAGNCNDVDVEQLARQFAVIHLVDIDAGALDRAKSRLSPEVRARTTAHGGVDLTGLLQPIEKSRGKLGDDEKALAQAVDEGTAGLLSKLPAGQGRVVVSCCLLSQLGWSLEEAAAGDDERGMRLRVAALTVHLRTLAGLCRSGGTALIAADIVSSQLYPLDELEEGVDLRQLAADLIARQDIVYASANPVLVGRLLRKDDGCKDAFAPAMILTPWLWTGQFERTYLVYPQLLQRR